jgi:hypothetical protein
MTGHLLCHIDPAQVKTQTAERELRHNPAKGGKGEAKGPADGQLGERDLDPVGHANAGRPKWNT